MVANHQSGLLGGQILNDIQDHLDALFRLDLPLEVRPDLLEALKNVSLKT